MDDRLRELKDRLFAMGVELLSTDVKGTAFRPVLTFAFVNRSEVPNVKQVIIREWHRICDENSSRDVG